MNSLICGNELQGPAVQGGKYSADVLAEQGIYNPAAFPAKPSIVVIHPSRSQSNAIPVLEHGIVRIGDSHSGDHFSELMSDDFLPPAASDSSRPQVLKPQSLSRPPRSADLRGCPSHGPNTRRCSEGPAPRSPSRSHSSRGASFITTCSSQDRPRRNSSRKCRPWLR